ncbi:MAG: hypothetical protein PSX36_05355 [bacterium]|nr:hypothetical protein [bacterium]
MANYFLILFFLLVGFNKAQDRIYFLDGKRVEGHVEEIGPEDVIIRINPYEPGESNLKFPVSDILLIEYKNGKFELFNAATKNSIFTPQDQHQQRIVKSTEAVTYYNMTYLNTLALCNSDISLFYERLNPTKKIGIGVMTAYNFNKYAGVQNINIAILNDPKKNYDLGAFCNFYPAHFRRKTTTSFGVLMKYMNFSFSSVTEEKSGTSSTLVYTPANGYQMATMFTFGTHTNITKDFFIKTSVGLGGFTLRGTYKQQYNYILNQNRAANTPEINSSFLLKAYLSFNVGYNF